MIDTGHTMVAATQPMYPCQENGGQPVQWAGFGQRNIYLADIVTRM